MLSFGVLLVRAADYVYAQIVVLGFGKDTKPDRIRSSYKHDSREQLSAETNLNNSGFKREFRKKESYTLSTRFSPSFPFHFDESEFILIRSKRTEDCVNI